MQIGHYEIFVRNPVDSIAFYRDALGFEVVEIQAERYVWLRSGESLLLLRPSTAAHDDASYQSTSIATVLYSDDLAAATARLAEHGVAIRGDDGPGCLTFTDPDGHWFQLVDPGTK